MPRTLEQKLAAAERELEMLRDFGAPGFVLMSVAMAAERLRERLRAKEAPDA